MPSSPVGESRNGEMRPLSRTQPSGCETVPSKICWTTTSSGCASKNGSNTGTAASTTSTTARIGANMVLALLSLVPSNSRRVCHATQPQMASTCPIRASCLPDRRDATRHWDYPPHPGEKGRPTLKCATARRSP